MRHERRDLLRGLASAAAVGVAGCAAAPSGNRGPTTDRAPPETIGEGPELDLEPVASGLVSPTQLTAAPGSGTRFVLDQIGTVHVLGDDGGLQDRFLDLRDRVVVSPERGLLGMAFHPSFPDDSRLFLRYSVPRREGTPADYSHTEVLTEMRVDERPRLETERVLVEFPSPTIYHQAGSLAFGPDGLLYVPMGEGTVDRFAQDLTENLLGGILRIDVDGSTGDRPYGIPDDNPRVGRSGRDEYYAWGFRNPWRLSFSGGDLVVGDVGGNRREELTVVRAGGNHGWPYREGTYCRGWGAGGESGDHCGVDLSTVPGDDFVDPVIEFPHSGPAETLAGRAVIAGATYDRTAIPALEGRYLFSNYTRTLQEPRGELWAADPTAGDTWSAQKLTVGNGPDGEIHRVVNSIGRDSEGAVYLLAVAVPDVSNRFDARAGEVLKVVPPGDATAELAPT